MSATVLAAPTLDANNPVSIAGAARPPRRRLRGLLGWAAILLLALLLWPANWGGFTGITTVNGHSMDPTFASGDIVISLRQASYSVGDIISYEVPAGEFGAGHRVVHRIFAIDDSSGTPVYLTKGDNNLAADEWRPETHNVLGRVVLRLPSLGMLLSPAWIPYEAGGIAGILVIATLWPRRKRQEAPLEP